MQTILDKSAPGASGRLLRPGGLIVADNVLRRGLIADSSSDNPAVEFDAQMIKRGGSFNPAEEVTALKAFNTALHESGRIDTWLVPLFDGVGLGRLLD